MTLLYPIVEVYAYRGQISKAFEWLSRAYDERDRGLAEIKTDPLLENLRHDQRYADLLKKMQLPAKLFRYCRAVFKNPLTSFFR